MKICWTIILLLSTVFLGYAQEKNSDLPYPDLIPVLKNGLYGYCDKDMNVIIKPQFTWGTFFTEDPDFLDIKDAKKKAFGSSDYATVWQDGQRMRIDKNGLVVYRYRQEDFNVISPKESMNPSQSRQPFEKFQDDKTKLWGIRNIDTGDTLIQAQYPIIEEELYSYFHVPQYPLFLVSSLSGENKFYVGLNGVEYRVETITAPTKTEDYKIDYRVYLSGSDSATVELQGAMVLWDEIKPFIRAYVTTEKIRVESNGYPSFVQIVNFADNTSFRYRTQMDSTKTVERKDAIIPQISFDPFSEEPFVDAMTLTLTDDTQTIAGYPCNLARFVFGKDMEFLVWYVKDLPKLFFGKHDFLKKIPGLPLKITVSTKETDFEFGIMATSVEKQKIDPSLFDLPEEAPKSTDVPDNAYLESLPYPDLIPVSEGGLVGYCDRDMNVIIEPQFYQAEFFETDFSFQITNVNNPDIVRFGTDDYAWVVTMDEKRYRIDKKGYLVYHYNEADFKSDAPFISLDESDGFKVTGIDKITLFQIMNDSLSIVDPAFYAITKIDTLSPKGTNNDLPDMLIRCYPSRESLPLSTFRNEKTHLEGLKHWDTEQIVIEPKYTMIDPLFNRNLKPAWYPLFRAFSPSENTSFYVGLDGTEYIIRPKE
ncbi:MAG: hypothetical protein EAS52_11590 [Parapedobacter sp.]|nr:MAG: hypothetical protein EAS52_11590 [Parapedobacter sp.]